MKLLKNSLMAIAVAFAVFSFSGCGEAGPEGTAQAFLNALHDENYDQAKEFSTEGSAKMIDMIASLSSMAGEEMEKGDKPTVSTCEVDGDNATCTYCCTTEGEESTLSMKKVDGEWKADFSKESMMDDAAEGLDDMEDELDDAEDELDAVMDSLEDMGEDIEAMADSLDTMLEEE